MRSAAVLLLLIGCGFPKPADVGDAGDALSDGLVDTLGVAPHSHYVTSSLHLPTSNTDARNIGLDLNDDATVDNQMGMVIATFIQQGIDTQTAMTKAIDKGLAIQLLDLQTADFANEPEARFQVFVGANPSPAACTSSGDMTCRHHLDGTATFDLAHPSTDAPLVGPITSGTFAGRGGHATVLLSLLGSAPFEVTLIGARVRLTSPTASVLTGSIGGALTTFDVDNKFVPAIVTSFNAKVANDCTSLASPPGCGCGANSDGKTFLALFDAGTKDCAISANEVKTSNLMASLLAPDVTLEGMMGLSVGFSFTAVKATYTVAGE